MDLILSVQESKIKDFEFLNPEEGNVRWSRNMGKKLKLFAS